MADKKPTLTEQVMKAGDKARKEWEKTKEETKKKQTKEKNRWANI